MMVTFTSTIDSISEDSVVCFVGKPGGYTIPTNPEDVRTCILDAFHGGNPVEITYDDREQAIVDARPCRGRWA